MELLLGFTIAALIAITGVGAGTLIAPLLILFLHVPVAEAVGTALAYSAAVKFVVVPVQIWRRQVEWRTLAIILATGIPGVAIGSIIFQHVAHNTANNLWLFLALGIMIALSSGWHIFRHFRPAAEPAQRSNSPHLLALVMLPIGAEVGFSSSGAGALGTLALLGLTPLDARRIVGTDLAFGLCLSLVGGALHLQSAALNLHIAHQSDRRRHPRRPHRSWRSPRAFPPAPCAWHSHCGSSPWASSFAGTRWHRTEPQQPRFHFINFRIYAPKMRIWLLTRRTIYCIWLYLCLILFCKRESTLARETYTARLASKT